MPQLRRIVLLLSVALAILLPFLAMSMALMGRPTPSPGMPQPAQFMSTGRSAADNVRRHPTAGIQAAGTKDSLWLMIPQQSMDGKTDSFKLWAHEAGDKLNGQDVWTAVHDQNGVILPRLPSFLTVQVPPFDDEMPSSAVVIYDDGRLMGYSLDDDFELPYLPDHQRTVALAGGGDHNERLLIVLARGPLIPATQPATQPSTQSEPTEKPATAPATAATAAATNPAEQWNLLHRTNSTWTPLPDISAAGDGPSHDAHIVIATQQDQLWALWYEPAQPDLLKSKCINWRTPGIWSAVITRQLSEPMTRIRVVTVPQMILLWPVKDATKATLALHGLTLSSEDQTRPGAPLHLLNFDLGDAGKDLNPDRDLAVSQLSNSIAVIIAGKDDVMRQLLFSANGTPNGPAVTADPNLTNLKASPYMENVRIGALMALMALSFVFWRRQPALLVLPKGVQMAALGQRIAAGVVDMSGPIVLVVLGFGLYNPDKFSVAWQHVMRFALDFSSVPVELLWLVGIYLVHVTISEMVNGRSLGKVVFGLIVVGLDGKRVKPAPILIRNLLRLPEWFTVVPIFAPLIPPFRQRIGDIVARTLVVQMHTLPPEEPEKDKDEESK